MAEKSTVKVRAVGTGEEFETSSSEAQDAFARGTVDFADDEIRVVTGDNRSGRVSRANLSEALAQGWTIASDAEAEAKGLRREASGVVGTIQGSAEAVARGASLGFSDVAIDALGGDSKRMAARQEALGGIGTGLEVGGAVAASVLTGGGGAVAQGAGRATALGTAKALAKKGAGLIGKPTRLATGAGDAVAGLVAGTEATLGRQVLGRVAGGAVEGAIGGAGGVMSESVLHDKSLTAEALLGGMAAGAVFGGVADGGASAVFGGLAKGAGATRDALRKVLARETGVPEAEVSDALIDAAAKDHWLGTAAEKLAPLSGADPIIAKRIGNKIGKDPKRIADLLNRRGEIEKNVGETFQTGLNNVRSTLDEAHVLSQGEAKYSSLAGKLPHNADFTAPRLTEGLRSNFEGRLASMVAENKNNFGRAYDVGALRETDLLVKRALEESKIDGGGAMASFRAMDRMKRDLSAQIQSTGGWGAPKMGTTTDVIATNKALREMYAEVKGHLERDDLWGAAASQQRELNASFAASQKAAAEFKNIATGSGVRGLFAPDGTVNMRQAITLARQFRRMGGNEVVSKFDQVLDAQLAHLGTIKKYYDLGRDELASIKKAEDSVREIREKLDSQAEDAADLDDLESLREAESNRSPSMGVMSTIGPTVGTMLGFGALGPVGAAVGAIAGGVLRPYSTARTMASLLSLTDKFKGSFDAKKYVGSLAKGVEKVGRKAAEVGRATVDLGKKAGKGAIVGGAFQAGDRVGEKTKGPKTTQERVKHLAKLADRVSELGTEENLRKALGPEWEVLANDMPELAVAFEERLQRAVSYLDQHRPKVTRRPFSGRPPIVDPVDAARFERRYEAVVHPELVLNRLREGRLTVEHVDALREVYPKHYQGLVDGIQEAMVEADEKGKAPSHNDRVKLSILLGQPLDASLEPAHLQAMGSVYGGSTAQAANGPSAPAPQQSGKIRAAGADRLDFNRLETPSQTTASGRLRE